LFLEDQKQKYFLRRPKGDRWAAMLDQAVVAKRKRPRSPALALSLSLSLPLFPPSFDLVRVSDFS